jgi:nicotinamidase-related amidase
MPRTALLVIDMLNPYDHDDADELAESVGESLPRMVELRDRAQATDDVLLVYANDNYERWDETRDDLVRNALEGAHPELVEPIVPPHGVPFLPKGRHSVFYKTPLDHLLQMQEVKRVVLCGQVTEQCIFYSALDAYLRGFEVEIPPDAVAHIVPEFAEAALGMAQTNLHAELAPAGKVALSG